MRTFWVRSYDTQMYLKMPWKKHKSFRNKLNQRNEEIYAANRGEIEKELEEEVYSYYTATDDESENENTSED